MPRGPCPLTKGPRILRRLTLAALAASILLPATAHADNGCDTHKCRSRVQHRQYAERHGGCQSVVCVLRVERKHWTRLRASLPPQTVQMLARLRACESTGNYRATNGTHWGAYQYSWGRGSAGARAGFRVRPDLASPAEQDVRTARFFPRHRGEWACRA
jgi:hypothetical protein